MIYNQKISWKKIWENKGKKVRSKKLEDLLSLNGHISPSSNINVKTWREYINYFIKKYKINSNHTVLEVGCGAGAFLLPFYEKKINCVGIDYSNTLLKHCKYIMPKSIFYQTSAIDLTKCKRFNYDFIFANSIFQYFKNFTYAKKVIKQIINLSNNRTIIILLDIPDRNKYNDWKKTVVNNIGKKDFKKKYSKLKHQFYKKNMFRKISFLKDHKIKIFNQNLIKKENSKFRFNILIYK